MNETEKSHLKKLANSMGGKVWLTRHQAKTYGLEIEENTMVLIKTKKEPPLTRLLIKAGIRQEYRTIYLNENSK